ncbi:MAG: DUF2752 domain-containing protein [Gemmataceae bacterium]|nr:DUF2752 domain-containing protein [Gemmataceae bacterium]
MGSHEQMGFPKCNFLVLTGMPCPSCGMTTSFALLVRGDLWNSLKANPVGTLLAGFLLALIPWSIACLMKGRFLLVRRVEIAMGLVLGVFITLALVRWAWIVAPHFWKW